MKLLVCGYCKDVRKLGYRPGDPDFWTVCECGKSRGRYVNVVNCEFEGDDAHVFGLRNDEVLRLLGGMADPDRRVYLEGHFEPRGGQTETDTPTGTR